MAQFHAKLIAKAMSIVNSNIFLGLNLSTLLVAIATYLSCMVVKLAYEPSIILIKNNLLN